MTAANFLARMNNITRPAGAPTSNAAPAPAAAQPPSVSAAPVAAPGGFTIPGTTPAPAPVAAPPFSGGVVGMPSAPAAPNVNELTQQNAPVVQSMTSAAPAPFQINPPEGALPPPPPPTASEPPAPPTSETLPDAAGKGTGRRRKAASGAAPASPSVSDDYLEHHARQCAALQGAFANPHLTNLQPEDFANFVMARLTAFEALGGAK